MNETELKELEMPLITDDAVVLGLLVACLALIFYTSSLKSLKGFYKFVPALLAFAPPPTPAAVISLDRRKIRLRHGAEARPPAI